VLVYVTAHVAQADAKTLGGLFQVTWLPAVHVAFKPDSGYLVLPCTASVLLHMLLSVMCALAGSQLFLMFEVGCCAAGGRPH
jgi:hypothetical protein